MTESVVELLFFLAVARTGSLTAAAREMSVTQPTVGRYINTLEERLNQKLFNRSKDGMTLTEAGEAIYPHAKEVELAIEAFDRRIQSDADEMAGTVRLSTTEGLGALWVVPRIDTLGRKYPALNLELILENDSLDLTRREADVALRLGQPTTTNLTATRVGSLSLQLMASRSYIAQYGAPATVEELSSHRIVSTRLRSAPSDGFWQKIIATGAHVGFTTNSTIAQVEAVRNGVGISVLPSYVGRKYDDLEPIMPNWRWQPREIWLVTHVELRTNPRVRVIMDEMTSLFMKSGTDLIEPYIG